MDFDTIQDTTIRQRDQEIAGSAKFFRMWLYDYDVENAAIGYLSKV